MMINGYGNYNYDVVVLGSNINKSHFLSLNNFDIKSFVKNKNFQHKLKLKFYF